MVYPLGKQKLGSSQKINDTQFWFPIGASLLPFIKVYLNFIAWCTVNVKIQDSELPKLVPRDHHHFHFSFAQIGYLKTILPDNKEIQFPKSDEIQSICVCCLAAPPAFAFIPCGHKCICVECSKQKYKECPVCRSSFMTITQIFG